MIGYMMEYIHNFIEAALPWMTIATAIAIVYTVSDAAKKENNSEK